MVVRVLRRLYAVRRRARAHAMIKNFLGQIDQTEVIRRAVRRANFRLKQLVEQIEHFWARRNVRVDELTLLFMDVEDKALWAAHKKNLDVALAARKAKMYKGLVTKQERDGADRLFAEFSRSSIVNAPEAIDKQKTPPQVRRGRLGLFYKKRCIEYGHEISIWRDSVKNTIQAAKDLKAFLGQETREFVCPTEPKPKFWDMNRRDMGLFVIRQHSEMAEAAGDDEEDPLTLATAEDLIPQLPQEAAAEDKALQLEDLVMTPLKLPRAKVELRTLEALVEVESDAGAPKLGAREEAEANREENRRPKKSKSSQDKKRFTKFG
jgi:hypothetical protein